MKKLCLALFAVFSFATSAASLGVDEMEALLAKSFADPSAAAFTAERFGLTGERREILRQHNLELSRTPEVLRYLAEQFAQLGLDLPETKEDLKELMLMSTQISEALYRRGLSQSGPEDQAMALLQTARVSLVMPPRDCRTYNLHGVTRDLAERMPVYLRKSLGMMKDDELRAHFRSMRRVMKNGTYDFPIRTPMTDSQRELAMLALWTAFEQHVRAEELDHAEALFQAMAHPDAASDADVCRASVYLMGSVFRLTGANRELALRFILD